ncbi:MAG: hypothetical protein H7145_18095, partial [Akkermansiaceae bacterium]|nr:hypothetical protein [Armatimonadota bacterium]
MTNFWTKRIAQIAAFTLIGSVGGYVSPVAVAQTGSAVRLTNGGFERIDAQNPAQTAGWTPYEQGYQLDSQVRRGGSRSLRCENPGGGKTFGAFVTHTLDQSRALPITVTGWSKAQNIDGVADNDYAVYVDVTYMDGSALWGQTATFETGTHDWQRGQVTIFPSKPVRSVNVYALLRNHAGTAWFDDFEVREMTANRLFDGQNIAPPVLSRNAKSGWFVRDVEAGTPLHPLTPGATTLGLRLDLQAATGGSVVRGTLRNLTPKSRAVTVYYVERFDAARPVWWNTVRDGVPATETREYANLTQAGAGATGQLSQYPFACVTGQGEGRALAVPPDLGPRVARISFRPDTRLLFLSYDLALNGKGDTARHDRAPVAVARYAVDPAWGFRDAAARFYALFPEAFKRRAKSEGIWMPFTDPANVAGAEDFHIAYHEGDNSIASDRRKGILSFKYVEPMTYWMPMAKGVPRNYSQATALVRKIAANTGDPVASQQAQAVLSSGSRDASGRLNVAFRDAPWCDGAVWVLNPNPRMGGTSRLWTKARLNDAAKPVPGKPDQTDGEYLDSLEAWADVLDYRPESLRASTVPLCFAPGRFRPTLPTWFSVY